MTVLSACAEAAIELNQPEPASLFSTSDPFAKELRLQANRAAVAIAKAHDWQALSVLNTITGDGTETSFALPADYDRMPLKTNLTNSAYSFNLVKARDLDQWAYYLSHPTVGAPGYWIILGGRMQINPAPPTGTSHTFYYISNNIVSVGGVRTKPAFTADTDTFALSERLLALGIVWRWRAMKRMEYAEDLRSFEIAMAEESMRDEGSRILTVGRQRMPIAAEYAHPPIIV